MTLSTPLTSFKSAEAPVKPSVWCIVAGQFVFYGASNMFLPSLYKHAQSQGWANAAQIFANALVAAAILTFLASFVLGAYADRSGEKRAYQVALLFAILADVMLSFSSNPYVFIAAWGTLKAVSEGLRGPKNAYMGKYAPTRFNFVSNVAMTSGIVGSIITPLIGGLLLHQLGDDTGFQWSGIIAATMHLVYLVTVSVLMPEYPDEGNSVEDMMEKTANTTHNMCVQCHAVLTEQEAKVNRKLCTTHFANYEFLYRNDTTGCSYRTFVAKVLSHMCVTVVLFQFAVNVTVMALFQPLMADHFGWQSADFSALQSTMSFLGFFVTSGMSAMSKKKFITAQRQNKVGGVFFFIAVSLFVIPPLSEYRLVAAQIFSFIAQISFQCAPLYGQIITKHHLTSVQLSILAAMIAVGQACGCAVAPFFLPYAGSALLTVIFLPVILGLFLITLLVRRYDPDGRVRHAEEKTFVGLLRQSTPDMPRRKDLC